MDAKGIIRTKLFVPQTVGATIRRAGIFNRLDQSQGWKLALVSAPAGFGKTTLVTDWLRENNHATAWVSLDDRDQSAKDVLRYIVMALEPYLPESAQQVLPLLNSPDSPSVEDVAGTLINALTEDSIEVKLVMDDYHSIASTEIHDLVWFLVQHAPGNLKTILITRSDPPFPLARLRSKMQLLEVRVEELAFSQEELTEFLEDQAITMGSEQVKRLSALTEGWIAGVKLAALSMANDNIDSFLDAFSGTDRNIMDYLIEEVLAHQTEDTRDFLLKTSILRGLNEELCDHVLKRSDSRAVLETFEAENLFITAMDQNRHWYRYHHLFAQILRYRLKSIYPQDIQQLHLRACQWYAEQGQISEAIFHAEAGEDIKRIEELVEIHSGRLLQEGRLAELSAWFEKLPEERVLANTDLGLQKAWLLLLTGELGQVPQFIEQVSQQPVTGKERDNIPGNLAAIQAYLAFFSGDPQKAISHAENALELSEPEDDDIISVAAFVLGNAYSMTGQFDPALRAYDRAIASAVRINNPHIEVPARNAAAPIERLMGKLAAAQDRYMQVLEMFERSVAPPPPLAIGYLGLGDLFIDKNEIGKATEYIEKGAKISAQWGNAEVKLQSSIVQTRLFLATKNYKKAGEALALLETQLKQRGYQYHKMDQIHALKVRYYLATSTSEKARRYLSEHGIGLDASASGSILNELSHIRVLIHEENYEIAWEYVDGLEKRLEITSNVMAKLELQLCALAIASTIKTEMLALEYLDQALDLARPEKILRPFLDAPGNLESLIRNNGGRATGQSDQFRTRIALELSRSGMLETEDGLIENLSDREMDVLTLVTQGLSNGQIAKQLFISLSTVKTHLLHIYSKLGVKNRTAASERARQLGLL